MMYAYRILVVLYLKKMYEDGREISSDSNTNLKNATITVDQVFTYILYLFEISRNVAALSSADSNDHNKKMGNAESELFSAVKMQPIMI